MTMEEIHQKKKELGYSNEMIAEKSGVPLGTVQKIFAGLPGRRQRRPMKADENTDKNITAQKKR